MQRLRFGHILQNRVVLQRPDIDIGVQAEDVAEAEQAFLLAAHRGPARAGGHEQWLDTERIARAEQFAVCGVPQREREHAAQPGQRPGAPIVVGGDDRLAVPVGGEGGAVLLGQFCA